MKREWTDLEFADWTLLPAEAALFANKTGPTRLGFASNSAPLAYSPLPRSGTIKSYVTQSLDEATFSCNFPNY
jgi:hypothetical protein